MRDIDVAVVSEAIIHRIERTADGAVKLELSNATICAGEGDAAVLGYLAEHIRHSVADHGAVVAHVADPEMPIAHALATAFEPAHLVAGSQALARHLYELVKKDKRLSDGTLAIAAYRPLTDDVTGPMSLAVMKLDASVQFVPVRQRTDAGVRITLQPVDSVLPSVRERLQKAAFVWRTADHQTELLVVDRQARGDEVASWFMTSYLGAQAKDTDATRTDSFYLAVKLIEQEFSDQLDDEGLRRLEAAGDQALRDERINTEVWVANRAELTPEQKARANEIVESQVSDVEFTVDRDTAERLLKRARFEGDDGLVVLIPTQHERRVGVPIKDPNTGVSYVRIETTTLARKR